MTSTFEKSKIRELVISETKTVAQLLDELRLSHDHVVLVDGERQALDSILNENDTVVVLPVIAGG
ncbi:MAG: MoaD/ThiS family protein [Candidatus Thorarchaeota archaeon]